MAAIPDFVVVIPARFSSVRLPGKPLRMLGGEPLVRHVARRAAESGASKVVVATDDSRVAEAVKDMDVQVCMTSTEHPSGSDRVAECARQFSWADDVIVVNLQGDEPFAPVSCILAVVTALIDAEAPMATLATPLECIDEALDPNCVKVVCDTLGRALYFSRAPLPWSRNAWSQSVSVLPTNAPYLRHIGLYAYRAGFLREFTCLPATPLEHTEALEQLRALEHGHAIAVGRAPERFPPGIDTIADLQRAEATLQSGVAP